MARLADDWKDQRQSCVDVLCAHYRIPMSRNDPAERQVRRAVLGEIFRRLTSDADVQWSDCRIDLSGALVEGLRAAGPLRVTSLDFTDATFSDFTFLDQVDLRGAISFQGATFKDGFRLLVAIKSDSSIWLSGASVASGADLHVGLWQSDSAISRPDFVHVNMNNLRVRGASATISLWGSYASMFLFASGVVLDDGSLTILTREGHAAPGAVRLPSLHLKGASAFRVNSSARASVESDVLPDIVEDAFPDDPDPRKAIFV
jgi:hypothetical protein